MRVFLDLNQDCSPEFGILLVLALWRPQFHGGL
jgi:hypothetical protein